MRSRARMRAAIIPEARAGEPKIEDRLLLSDLPNRAAVEDFVMTRSAKAVWAEINLSVSSPASSLLWIMGPAGSGKTHFLQYIFALSARAGAVSSSTGRHLSLAIPESPELAFLERQLAKCIVSHLATGSKGDALWRELADADALQIILAQARRQGVSSISVVIDCGLADEVAVANCEKTLLGIVKSVREPKLLLIAAARISAHRPEVRVCPLAPNPDEETHIAITKARRMIQRLSADGEIAMSAGDETSDRADQSIFPFHPRTVAAMVQLGPAQGRIAELARIAYEALMEWRDNGSASVIWPSRLIHLPRVRELIEQQLGLQGEAAIKIANAAVLAMPDLNRAIAGEIIDLLLLHYVSHGATPLNLNVLIQQLSTRDIGEEELGRITGDLAHRSSAVILFDRQIRQLRFNIHGSDAPAIAFFNASLNVLRHFDPALSQVSDVAELSRGIDRLRSSLGAALEIACRNREILTDLAKRFATALTKEQVDTLSEFIALVERGPAALLVSHEHSEQVARLQPIIDQYQGLEMLAQAAPRIYAMREYLLGMRLHEIRVDELNPDAAIVKLETECRVMIVEVNAAVHIRGAAQLDALEARFERFKWTYTAYYRAAHEEWRTELKKIAAIIEEGEKYRRALLRLETIPSLRTGAEICDEFDRLSRSAVRCDLSGRLAPEIAPLCPSCGFVIATPSPRTKFSEITAQMKRLLEGKLAQLSQNIIRRLIRHHNGSHRLEGFLKMTQAAQAGALIQMLDDDLVAYLRELFEENRLLGERRGIARLVSSSASLPTRAERTGRASPRKRER